MLFLSFFSLVRLQVSKINQHIEQGAFLFCVVFLYPNTLVDFKDADTANVINGAVEVKTLFTDLINENHLSHLIFHN